MTHRMTTLTHASAALLALICGASAVAAQDAAQDADTQDAANAAAPAETVRLDAITLIGTGLPTEVMYSPSSVTVIESDEINERIPSSVAKILSDVPGIRVSESGIERIRIRGESSQRVAIMLDGQRLSDHTNYGTPILIAPTEIERIEVVRGPSSVVSGNRAIGGVVNIVTKRGADKPVEFATHSGYLGANEGWRAAASVAGTVGNFDYRLSYSKSDLNDRETADGALVPSGGSDRDIHAFMGYRMDNHYFGLRVQDYDLAADVYTGDPAFNISLPKRDLRKYGIFYEGTDLTPWLKLLKLDAYRQTVDRSFINDITFPAGPFSMNVASTSEDEQKMRGFSATAHLEFAPGHRSVVGIEYEHDRLISDKTNTTSLTPPVAPPTISNLYSDAKIRTISAFGQHEMDLTEKLTATGGLRYYNVKSSLDSYVIDGVRQDRHESTDSRFLASLGLTYALRDDTVLRANISQGYTYASLSELYLSSTGGGGTILGNPDLDPEKSTSFEIGARIDRQAVLLDAVLFYTDSKDYIAAIGTGIPRQSQYRNVDAAKSWGLEVAAEFDPGLWGGMRPYVNLAGVSRKFEFQNGYETRDSGSPRWAGALGVRGDWSRGTVGGTWDLFMRGESTATQRDDSGAVVDRTGGWATLNFRGNVELTENVALTLEAENLLDKSYRAMDQIEGAGRNLSIFLTATF